jgi:hypothetical protein
MTPNETRMVKHGSKHVGWVIRWSGAWEAQSACGRYLGMHESQGEAILACLKRGV